MFNQQSYSLQITKINSFSILIVDDSPYNLFVLEELLLEISSIFNIDKAINGQDALDKIKHKMIRAFLVLHDSCKL
jgi:CheY-like chemotaxis protein